MTIFGPLVRNALNDPQVPISSPEVLKLFDGEPSTAGPHVDEKKSLSIAAVWRAVNLIAGTIASLPLHVYKPEADARVRITTGKAATLLGSPHPYLTRFEWVELIVGHILLWGNAYCVVQWDDKMRPWLLPLHPSTVTPNRAGGGVRKTYGVEGVKGTLTDATLAPSDEARILHIPGFGYDGVGGISAIKAARQSLGLALAAEEFGARLFANGSLSTGILTAEKQITDKQADDLQARWKKKRAGLDKAFDTIVLSGGLKYNQLTIPPEDAQFLESRSFQVSEIARWYGVPPHMLMDTDKSTSWGTGIEQQGIGFLTYTLRPWLARIEQRLSRLLTPEPAYARFGVEGLLRADSAARSTLYRELWSLGVLSTNEIRALEELPPVDGGDVRYRPLNMGELGSTDEGSSTDA